MGKLDTYKGTIEVNAGLKPKNDNTFPLMEAHDIVVDEDDKRLDEKLEEITSDITEIEESGFKCTAKVENGALIIEAGEHIKYDYYQEIVDENYVKALFSDSIADLILQANGVDTTEYHSGGVLRIYGDLDLSNIEFL